MIRRRAKSFFEDKNAIYTKNGRNVGTYSYVYVWPTILFVKRNYRHFWYAFWENVVQPLTQLKLDFCDKMLLQFLKVNLKKYLIFLTSLEEKAIQVT